MPRDRQQLSERQQRILEFIQQSLEERGYPPSVREIARAVGLKSPASVHTQLDRLEKQGLIRRGRMTSRALEVLGPGGTRYRGKVAMVPLVGRVTAGEPILAVENIEEYVPLPWELTGGTDGNVFVLTVRGDSMTGAGILDGDRVVVRQQESADNGDIVVALVGEEATVKRFFKEQDGVRLQPENPAMQPIYTRDVKILGKVIGLYRRI